ncbi:MAG: hypothetical protein ACKOFP_15775 [Actinomycetota bacterium]
MTGRSWLRMTVGVIALVIGTLAIAVGVAAAGSAIALHAVVGRAGVLGESLGTVGAAPPTAAIVINGVAPSVSTDGLPGRIEGAITAAGIDIDALIRGEGDFVLLAARPDKSGDVFLGIAPSGAVDAYLDGTPYAVAERPDGGAWGIVDVAGGSTPALPDAALDWTSKAVGSPAEIDAGSLEGRALVIMHPDASPGVQADLRLEYRVAHAPRTLQSAAVTATAAGLGGLLLVLLGASLVAGPRPQGRHA